MSLSVRLGWEAVGCWKHGGCSARGHSGQSRSSLLSGPSEQDIGCNLSWPFLERNIRETDREEGEGQGELGNIPPPHRENLRVCDNRRKWTRKAQEGLSLQWQVPSLLLAVVSSLQGVRWSPLAGKFKGFCIP